jgi:hypothetical protein
MTTEDLRLSSDNRITLIANRDKNKAATTKLYLDDGFVENTYTAILAIYEILISANSIKKWQIQNNDDQDF